jgi:hypothetical protein
LDDFGEDAVQLIKRKSSIPFEESLQGPTMEETAQKGFG